MLYFVGRKFIADDVAAVIPEFGDIGEYNFPGRLTPDVEGDVVIAALVFK